MIPGLWFQILLFATGLILLVEGADFLVKGSSRTASMFGIPPLVIGLTIVACGTSLPELTVSLTASLSGVNDIAIGNIIGSNIANICLILGVSALIRPLNVRLGVVRREMPMMLGAMLAMLIMSFDGRIGRLDGMILLICFVAYVTYFVRDVLRSNQRSEVAQTKLWYNALMVIGGLLAALIGARLLVNSAVVIARTLGITEAVIGLSLVALGTSLPELMTSAMASLRGRSDIAIGNVLGSNLFNILLVIGICAAIIPLTSNMLIDLIVMCLAGLIVVLLFWSGLTLTRGEGALLLGAYGIYLAYLYGF
ncbi:MAG: calcium/sodium antiporter [Methanocellales archaeon]|nr:calcium/sodium antiporter [Methanocellales archaeon]